MARTSLLLVIGLVFLGLALLGLALPSAFPRPEERSQTTEHIPGGALQPPSTCAPPADWTVHVVQSGETLGAIAFESGLTTRELLVGNCLISNPNLLYVGQVVYVPPQVTGTPQQPYSPPEARVTPRPYVVEAEWPVRMETRRSSTIRVSLVSGPDGLIPTVEIEGNTAVLSTPIPVGTVEADLRRAFGTQYEPYATAHLEGTSFEIRPASPEVQSLAEPRLSWLWNIASESPGPQSIDGYIEVEWRPVDGGERSERRQIWSFHFEVEVLQPLFIRGQVNVFSLVSGFIGSGLSIPWLYDVYNKRRSQRRRARRTA